jgi:hypothetical protein
MAAVPYGCGGSVTGLDVHAYRACLSRTRRRSRHRQPFDAACDGDHCLWRCGLDTRRRALRRAQAKALTSAAAPHTGHVRHDHRAARPKFLHIGCIADPNRIGSRIVARINPVRLGQVAGINPNPPRRTGRLCEWLSSRGLRSSRALWCRLRVGAGCQQRTRRHQAHREGHQNRLLLLAHFHAHPSPLAVLRSPIAATTSTG